MEGVADPFVPPTAMARFPLVMMLAGKLGISATTSARNPGAAAEPVVGPAQTVLAVSFERPIVKVPDPVIGEPEIVKPVGTACATLVTVPPLPVAVRVATPPETGQAVPVEQLMTSATPEGTVAF